MENDLVRLCTPSLAILLIHSQLLLERERNPIWYNAKHDTTPGRRYTFFFRTESERPILRPPLLHPNCSLVLGDLFWHKPAVGDDQIWLRVADEATQQAKWQAIEFGYVREDEDGRHLTLTPSRQALSWVGGDWGTRRVTESA